MNEEQEEKCVCCESTDIEETWDADTFFCEVKCLDCGSVFKRMYEKKLVATLVTYDSRQAVKSEEEE